LWAKADLAGSKSDFRSAADFVAKFENRTTVNIAKVDLSTFSVAASLFNAATKVRDRFWMKRYGPLRRRAQKRISGSKNFRSAPRKDFCNNIPQ
jgi:hypothetical protein